MATSARVALHYAGEASVRVVDVELPDPEGHQVLVRIESSGICRSQLREMAEHETGGPVPLGHEAIGVVESIGASVDGVEAGDRVILTWVPRAGEGIRDSEWIDLALPDGTRSGATTVFTWATHTLVDENFVIRAAPEDRAPELALVGCALITGYGAAAFSAKTQPGDTVAIIGAGGVGLAAVLGAKRAGAARIIVIDVDDRKLEFSRVFGATDTINSRNVEPVARVRELVGTLGCAGADVVIDCVGVTATIAQAIASGRDGRLGANTGAAIVLAGLGDGEIQINSAELIFAQKRIIGTFAGDMRHAEIAEILSDIRSGDLDVSRLVTDTFAFDELEEGVARLAAGEVLGRAVLLP